MGSPDVVYVICVRENDTHIEASILTHCVKCGCKVWCSITNCDKQTICMDCVLKLKETPGDEVEFCITSETIAEAFKEIFKRKGKK